jgi:HPt (histidine-containing phosphotransfer) domain-containing protein
MTTPPDPAVLDLDHLGRQTAGDRALEGELLALFEAQCARLSPLVAEGASVARADAAHTLKGSAKAIGAWPLASLADSLEAALRSGVPDPASKALAVRLEEAIETTRRAVAERARTVAI